MASSPKETGTIFNAARINALNRGDLITALLENDEDYIQANLINKTNAQLRRELLEQSDELLEEVKERDAALDADPMQGCDPTVSGDCAEEKVAFFENDLAPKGEARVISPAEVEVSDLRAELGTVGLIQQRRDMSFRGMIKAMMRANKEQPAALADPFSQDLQFVLSDTWVKYYWKIASSQGADKLHEQVENRGSDTALREAVEGVNMDALQKDLLDKDVIARVLGTPCTLGPELMNRGLNLRITGVNSVLKYMACTSATACAGIDKPGECFHMCGFFAADQTVALCSMRSIGNNAVSRVVRFIVLCLTNFDIKDLGDKSGAVQALKRTMQIAKIRQGLSEKDEAQYKRTIIAMNAHILLIQLYGQQWQSTDGKLNNDYIELVDAYLDFIHDVQHRAASSLRGEDGLTIIKLLGDVVGEIEKAVVLIMVGGAECADGTCPIVLRTDGLARVLKEQLRPGLVGVLVLQKLALQLKAIMNPAVFMQWAWQYLRQIPTTVCQNVFKDIGWEPPEQKWADTACAISTEDTTDAASSLVKILDVLTASGSS